MGGPERTSQWHNVHRYVAGSLHGAKLEDRYTNTRSLNHRCAIAYLAQLLLGVLLDDGGRRHTALRHIGVLEQRYPRPATTGARYRFTSHTLMN
jgi:hypothetical protein